MIVKNFYSLKAFVSHCGLEASDSILPRVVWEPDSLVLRLYAADTDVATSADDVATTAHDVTTNADVVATTADDVATTDCGYKC